MFLTHTFVVNGRFTASYALVLRFSPVAELFHAPVGTFSAFLAKASCVPRGNFLFLAITTHQYIASQIPKITTCNLNNDFG